VQRVDWVNAAMMSNCLPGYHATYGSRSKSYHIDPLRFCRAGGGHAERHAAIAKAAYWHAQRRNFEGGHELEDWLAAEAEFDQLFIR
jgi:hypothetical protein